MGFLGIKSEEELKKEMLKEEAEVIIDIKDFFGKELFDIVPYVDRNEIYAFFKKGTPVAEFCWETWGSSLSYSGDDTLVGFPIYKVNRYVWLSQLSNTYAEKMKVKFPNMKFVRFYIKDYENKIVFTNVNDGTRHEYFVDEMDSVLD